MKLMKKELKGEEGVLEFAMQRKILYNEDENGGVNYAI